MNREIENEASVDGMLMNAYPDVLTNNGSGGQNSLYKIVTENNQHIIVFPHSTDLKERNTGTSILMVSLAIDLVVRCLPWNKYYLLHHSVLYLNYMHCRQMKVSVN
jgi:hypothetical protein